MRHALILVCLLLSSFAASAIELNQANVNLGNLSAHDGELGQASLTVVRNSTTPKRVRVNFIVDTQERVCTRSILDRVWEPGYYRRICQRVYTSHDNWFYHCENIYQNGYYRYETRCIDWDWKPFSYHKHITLNFRRAKKLRGSEQEKFRVRVSQRSIMSSKVDVSGEVIEANQSYKIRDYLGIAKFFGANGLKFIKQ